MALFRRRKEPTRESMQKMVRLASDFGDRAVAQYRSDVAELGFTPQLGGELKARLLGAAVPTVSHNKKYGLTHWPRVAPSMVGHALSMASAEADSELDDMYVNPEQMAEYGTAALLFIDQHDVGRLSHFYQAALLDSCGGEGYLQQIQSDQELGDKFLHTAAGFVSNLLSTWCIQAELEFQ
jgi:hypothetical protein